MDDIKVDCFIVRGRSRVKEGYNERCRFFLFLFLLYSGFI